MKFLNKTLLLAAFTGIYAIQTNAQDKLNSSKEIAISKVKTIPVVYKTTTGGRFETAFANKEEAPEAAKPENFTLSVSKVEGGGTSTYILNGNIERNDKKRETAKLKSKIMVYPNPAGKEFFIKGNFELPATMELYDIMGRKVKEYKIISTVYKADVSHLAKGLYVWCIGTARGKVVVE